MSRRKAGMRCEDYQVGDEKTRSNRKGRKITFERVRKFGKGRHLCWLITSNVKMKKKRK